MIKTLVVIAVLLIVTVSAAFIIINKESDDRNDEGSDPVSDTISITINGHVLSAQLSDNSSAKAFVERLKNGPVTVHMDHYGGFEIVGELGFSLPKNDRNITTSPGDIILYQGDKVTIYYDVNTYSFTKLGKISDTSQSELKSIIGSGSVNVTFSL